MFLRHFLAFFFCDILMTFNERTPFYHFIQKNSKYKTQDIKLCSGDNI